MAEFFTSQIDYIFFFYGLSSILLLPLCHFLNRRPQRLLPWMLLGLFGLTHGLNEWLDLLAMVFGEGPALDLVSIGLMILSFVFLMEFGRVGTLNLRGRAPGRWITAAFLGLALLGGFAGSSGLCVMSRYTLGLVGGLWAGWVLYLASKNPGPGKRALSGASLGMTTYALVSGMVVSPAPFFPASWVNAAAFFSATGFPIQLVRGLLTLWLAACLCLFAQASLAQEAQSRVRVWGRTLMSGAVVGVIALLLLGWFTTEYFSDEAAKEIRSNQASHAKVLVRMMMDKMEEADHLVTTMAASPSIAPALERADVQSLKLANSVMDRYCLALEGSVCYLMDLKGMTIASSNRSQTDSFVGKNFKFRPYFKDAVKGQAGQYWALGVTSKELGYYASSTVRNRAGQIVGVAVLKRPIGDLGNFFPPRSLGVVLDSRGIVVMSNRPELVLKSLWPLSPTTMEHLVASRQFGTGPFEPILSQEPVDGGEYLIGGKRQVALRWPFPWEDWSIVSLMPMYPIILGRLMGIGVTLLVCLGVIGFLSIIGMTIDSTARIQSSEKRYRILYDNLRDGFATMDLEGTFIECNPAFQEMLGYSKEELCRLTYKDITPAKWHPMTEKIIAEQVFTRGYSDLYEKEYRRRNGSLFPVELRNYLIRGEGGKPAGMTVFARDITVRHQVEHALRESEQKYRELVTTVPAMVFRGYADWAVDFFDDKIEGLTGYPIEDFTSRKMKWSELIWSEDLESAKKTFKHALKTDKSYMREYRIKGKLGTVHWIRERGQIVCYPDGKINYISGVFSDITRQHETELALKKSERKYRLVFENAPAGIVQFDKKGIVNDCNEKFVAIIGASREKVIGFDMPRRLRDEKFREAVLASLNGQCGFYEGDYLSVLGDKLTPVRAIFQGVLSLEDDLVGGVGIFEDITVRREAEEELNKSLSLLHATLESTADGILVVDRDGRIVSFNHKFLDLWRLPKEIIASKNDQQVLDSVINQLQHPEGFLNKVKELYEHPERESFDVLEFTDGRFFERYSTPQRLGDKIVGRVWSFRDISERIQAETDLERLRLQHELILNSAGEGVFGVDLKGKVTFINPAALTLSGYKKNELFGQNIHKLLHYQRADGSPYPEEECPIYRTLRNGEGRRVSDEVFWTKDGKPLPVEYVASPLEENGRLVGAVGVFRDITERKQWEEDLQKANAHLHLLVSESEERNHHMTLLHEMSDVLQACQTTAEAYKTMAHFAPRFFPGFSGGLYMLNNSKNLFEKVTDWGASQLLEPVFVPDECWALRLGREHLVDDPASGLLCRHMSRPLSPGYLCMPMMAQGEAIGILHLQRTSPGNVNLIQATAPLAATVAEGVALALANLKLRETLRRQAIRDDLTGLFNRRYMEETLERELHRVARLAIPLGLAMMDLDHFKKYNDTFGHHAGDELLRALGQLIRGQIREDDIACRYGGEEFLIIMPGASLEITIERTEHMRQCVKQLHELRPAQFLHPITISIGLAIFPDNAPSGSALIQAADAALYRAKKGGRDRVIAVAA
jgi:diguanylate cyclase (GGDEF)-like protein/PAS domain S-box-containing protein